MSTIKVNVANETYLADHNSQTFNHPIPYQTHSMTMY